MRSSCPICCAFIAVPQDACLADVFVCCGCIAVVQYRGATCESLSESELRALRAESPATVAALEQDRIDLAKRWIEEERAPTIFAAVAAQLYVTRGPDSLRLPGKPRDN